MEVAWRWIKKTHRASFTVVSKCGFGKWSWSLLNCLHHFPGSSNGLGLIYPILFLWDAWLKLHIKVLVELCNLSRRMEDISKNLVILWLSFITSISQFYLLHTKKIAKSCIFTPVCLILLHLAVGPGFTLYLLYSSELSETCPFPIDSRRAVEESANMKAWA